MRKHLRLRLVAALLVAGALTVLAVAVLGPLPAAAALIVAAAVLGTLFGWAGGLAALGLALLADGRTEQLGVAAAGVLPAAALIAWRRWNTRDRQRAEAEPGEPAQSIEVIAQNWSAESGVAVILHTAGLERAIPELSWILREALANVAAHARAATVAVTLERGEGGLVLEVRDDGAGFAVPDTFANLRRNGQHGLVGMQERARLAGGHLTVWSRAGGGTRVTATVPAAVAAGAFRPSRKVRLLVGASAVAVPLALVTFLTTPDERASPFFAQETGIPLDPRATHGPTTPAPPPVTPGRASVSASPQASATASRSVRPPESASAAAAPASPAAPGPTEVAQSTCRVTYTKRSEWNPGFVADVKLTNLTASPLDAWSLRFDFGAGQKLTSYWNAVATQTGTTVAVGPTGDNPRIAAGGSLTFGLQGTWTGTNPSPAAFSLNGAPCA